MYNVLVDEIFQLKSSERPESGSWRYLSNLSFTILFEKEKNAHKVLVIQK